jgi:hypothetical protein
VGVAVSVGVGLAVGVGVDVNVAVGVGVEVTAEVRVEVGVAVLVGSRVGMTDEATVLVAEDGSATDVAVGVGPHAAANSRRPIHTTGDIAKNRDFILPSSFVCAAARLMTCGRSWSARLEQTMLT